MAVLQLRDGERAIVADDRYFPVLWLTWWGESNEALVHGYFEWHAEQLRRAQVENTKLVVVTDGRNAKRPPPTVRRLIGELTTELGPAAEQLSVATLLVLDNPVVRGAATAITWLTNRDFKFQAVPDLRVAMRLAQDKLRKAGIAPPAIDVEDCVPHSMPRRAS